jgi:hypothetical protein
MANRLADMHDVAPQLTEAVAERISSSDLREGALQDMGAFVHRMVVEDEHTYAVRIDDGAMLDAAEQIEHACAHLTADGQRQLAAILDCELERLDAELDMLAARAKSRALKSTSPAMYATARNRRYAFVHERGQDFAAGIWVVDPALMLDFVHEQLREVETAQRQRPVGGTGRHEPSKLDAIVDAELERALADPAPLRGIAQVTARPRRCIRARPRRRDPHQGARLGPDGAQAP